jgi:D-glycero-D-manno-heptose 1,7-bisphosphate phosphatase
MKSKVKKKALFLDRDGVINVNTGYLYEPKDVQWVSGIINVMRAFQQQGYLLIIVTNQSGIGRGYYSEEDFYSLTQWMRQYLLQQHVHIDDVFYCPHHPEKAIGHYLRRCDCRKPAPGMLLTAIEKWNIDKNQSVLIGDSWSDIEAGVAAGLSRCYFFSTDLSKKQQSLIAKITETNKTTKTEVVHLSHLEALLS